MDTKSIINKENYKLKIVDSNFEIFNQYLKIMDKYNNSFINSIHIINNDYLRYVYFKGVETLTHIFTILFMYTKNLSLTYFHCEKSLFYYIEFIGQIGDDNHSFLQLSSKDAILFVYKKTIYDINDSHKKEFALDNCDNNTIYLLNLFTIIYKQTINLYINTNNFNKANEIDNRNNTYIAIFNSIDKMFNDLTLKIKKNKSNLSENLEYLKKTLIILLNKNYNLPDNILQYILLTLTKNIDKENKLLKINNNIDSNDFDENYESLIFIKTNLLV